MYTTGKLSTDYFQKVFAIQSQNLKQKIFQGEILTIRTNKRAQRGG